MSTRYPCEFLVFERPARPRALTSSCRSRGRKQSRKRSSCGDSRHSKRQRSDRLRLDRPPRSRAGMRIG